jgi:hypothetical protein
MSLSAAAMLPSVRDLALLPKADPHFPDRFGYEQGDP